MLSSDYTNHRCSHVTNCAPLFVTVFIFSFELEFMQSIKDKRNTEATNLTFRYINDVLSFNDQNLINKIRLMNAPLTLTLRQKNT